MDAGSIGAISASVATPIALAVLRRVFPAPRRADVGRSLEDLRKEYGRWEAGSVLLLLFVAPVATYLWWRLFLAFATGCGFTHEGDVYGLRPGRIAWLLPAIFLGIMSAGPPIEAIVRRLLGDRYGEYLAYTNLRHGIDTTAPAFVAPSGEPRQSRQYVLRFSDSTSWNTNFEPSDATEAQLGSLVQAVAEWSGVPISELPVLTREDYD